jgi:diaminohydroxyphosphoribosylaminopyrimidine deaminase/5-amino-6-(5-phosphoribosylamino)uracil reductase
VEVLNSPSAQILLEPFLRWREGSFKLFKVGETLNGTITGGYITSLSSRKWVHQLRATFDAILIGGETIRVDKPILDARLVGGRPPDVIILTTKKEKISSNFPLFQVPGRRVHLVSSLQEVEELNYSSILVEGGGNFYKFLHHWVDWSLFIVAPSLKPGESFQLSRNMELLQVEKRGEDIFVWCR